MLFEKVILVEGRLEDWRDQIAHARLSLHDLESRLASLDKRGFKVTKVENISGTVKHLAKLTADLATLPEECLLGEWDTFSDRVKACKRKRGRLLTSEIEDSLQQEGSLQQGNEPIAVRPRRDEIVLLDSEPEIVILDTQPSQQIEIHAIHEEESSQPEVITVEDSEDVEETEEVLELMRISTDNVSDMVAPNRILVRGEPIMVGRSLDANVVLDSSRKCTSRLHALLRRDQLRNGWCVEDLKSMNGVYLNGERVLSACALRNGDHISFGIPCQCPSCQERGAPTNPSGLALYVYAAAIRYLSV